MEAANIFFESKFVTTDVTAIKILRNVILVGVGSSIHVFQKSSPRKLIHKHEIKYTRGEKIHGFVPFDEHNILVYGGPFIIIFEINHDFSNFTEIARSGFLDWILDAKLINNDKAVAAVSMQNKLNIFNLNLKSQEVIECTEKCILYSAHICYNEYEQLIILSGTVFSEILIWRPTRRNHDNECVLLARLHRHKGVIFSLHYNELSGYICSSSDDRSAVLWNIHHKTLSSEVEQEIINITPKCQVHGHSSRIFRCHVLTDCFITAGEDSIMNIWSLEGRPLKQIETHQGSPIWCLDCDESENNVITGGGDGGVSIFPLDSDISNEKLSLPNDEKPKLVFLTSTHNLGAFSDSGKLYLYLRNDTYWNKIAEFDDLKSYILLEVSKCRQLIALAGFSGQIYIYRELNNTLQHITSYQSPIKARIISLHWLSCESFLICQENGRLSLIYLKKDTMFLIATFALPKNIQQCTTTATMFKGFIAVGDRKGSLHLYKLGQQHPVQTLKRVHSHLGVTNLVVRKDRLMSLGRNSVVKTFSLSKTGLELISSDKLPFTWLLGLFDNMLTAFSGNNFVIWDYESKRVLFEKSCGGGHRSWDFAKKANSVMFLFIKDKLINEVKFDLSKTVPYNLIKGFHLNETNSIQALKYKDRYVLVSGGEDTTMRINIFDTTTHSFENIVSLKSHLSSVRSIAIHKLQTIGNNQETHLIFSAGGRAQVICWKLDCFFENNELVNVVCSEQHSYYKVIDRADSEMRIMHLSVTCVSGIVVLFCACSDGNIEVFSVEKQEKFTMKLIRNLFYDLKCVLLTDTFKILNHDVLVTAATDGKLVFWEVNNIFDKDLKPFQSVRAHQSGINALAKIVIGDSTVLFLTGGDDGAVVLKYFSFHTTVEGLLEFEEFDTFVDVGCHWAQITGCYISDKHFITASLDQRLLIFEWEICSKKIKCTLTSKYNTCIADLKGLLCFDKGNFLYGKGVEYVVLKYS